MSTTQKQLLIMELVNESPTVFMNSHQIYHLREAQLSEQTMYLIASLVNAYRPHDAIPTKEELGEPLTHSTCSPFQD